MTCILNSKQSSIDKIVGRACERQKASMATHWEMKSKEL